MIEVDRLRQRLLKLERELTGRLRSIDRDIRHEGMSADWSEQASERENDEVLESLGNSSDKELQLIRYALRRIDDGSYLTCDNCGGDIPAARLELLPFTPYCVDCAAAFEP